MQVLHTLILQKKISVFLVFLEKYLFVICFYVILEPLFIETKFVYLYENAQSNFFTQTFLEKPYMPAFPYPYSIMETPEQFVKSVQS